MQCLWVFYKLQGRKLVTAVIRRRRPAVWIANMPWLISRNPLRRHNSTAHYTSPPIAIPYCLFPVESVTYIMYCFVTCFFNLNVAMCCFIASVHGPVLMWQYLNVHDGTPLLCSAVSVKLRNEATFDSFPTCRLPPTHLASPPNTSYHILPQLNTIFQWRRLIFSTPLLNRHEKNVNILVLSNLHFSR